jgi:hypothetical protein
MFRIDIKELTDDEISTPKSPQKEMHCKYTKKQDFLYSPPFKKTEPRGQRIRRKA